MRNLLSTRANLVHDLADGVGINHLSDGPETSKDEDFDLDDRAPSKAENWLAQFLENLEVLLAERRVDEALAALDEGEQMAEESKSESNLSPSALLSLQTAIMEHRKKLADQLAEVAGHPSISVVELRSVVKALKRLGDGPRAHTLLLKSHHQKLHTNIQSVQPLGTSYAVAYTTFLSQSFFSTIAQAANDSLAIFDEEPAYASELVTWAVNETETFALLIKKNVLALPAASGGLRPVAECVHVCFGHCSLLESRGLALSPVLFKIFRPFIEQAMRTNLKRIEQSTAALAADDDWSLYYPPVGSRAFGTSIGSAIVYQPKLSSSGHKFNTMVQEHCEDISPLQMLQLSDQAFEGVLQVFNGYVNILVNALPGSSETENLEGGVRRIVRTAETEPQQVALLANALILADELLPRAIVKLTQMDESRSISEKQARLPEQRELKRRLQRMVDQLRDSFCRLHALELIFNEDGSVRLGADMYLNMDASAEEPEWFPSPIYQELFSKLTRIAGITSDLFVGRERFATMLLMRLTETIILWLSDDQTFWEEIENGPRPLGPLGLQQFYLDMEFVILFASQGRYLSRNLHQVIKNIIGRAIEAVAVNNIDPYSLLPEDDWFADVAQIAIKMLTGKANFGDVDQREGTSPSASVSAKSVSSVYSHGSN